MPTLKPVPAHCPACLDTGRVWDYAHLIKIRCACQHTTEQRAAA